MSAAGHKIMKNKNKIILDLAGGTGAWSRPYKKAGYNVKVVTLPEDVRMFVPPKKIYGILAAPPCTHLSGSGARWWKQKGDKALLEALSVADACLRLVIVCNPVFWCLENPVGRLRRFYGDPAMIFQPHEYGDPYTKKTLLWGKFNIPRKTPCNEILDYNETHDNPKKRFPSKMHLIPPSADRQEIRSITPEGFSQAFFEANQ